jgi:hypothetical protein
LSGGFKGRLAIASPRLRPGACTLDQFMVEQRLFASFEQPAAKACAVTGRVARHVGHGARPLS